MIQLIDLTSQAQDLLMARHRLNFSDYGITEDANAVVDRILQHFNRFMRGHISIDELLLHPSDAIHFCNRVRELEGWFGVPDDVILRPILNERKKPS